MAWRRVVTVWVAMIFAGYDWTTETILAHQERYFRCCFSRTLSTQGQHHDIDNDLCQLLCHSHVIMLNIFHDRPNLQTLALHSDALASAYNSP